MRRTPLTRALQSLLLLCSLGALAGSASGADRVFVRARENGQGLLRERNGECFVVTPAHVVEGSARIHVVAPGRLESPARFDSVYPHDLAILRVEAKDRFSCAGSWELGDALQQRLEATSEAAVISLNEDGSVQRRFVRVNSFDERMFTVRPVDRVGDALFGGLSGSAVQIRGYPAGMLMEVDPESGEGLVLRRDYLSALVDRFFAVERPETPVAVPEFSIEPVEFLALASRATKIYARPDRLSSSVGSLSVGETVRVNGRVRERLWYRIAGEAGGGFVPRAALQPL